jgi:hypothetical protein
MKERRFLFIGSSLLIIFVIIQISGCAPGNERWDEVLNPDNAAGFWAGVWHGIIIIITFIISLFTHEVGLYEIHNTGWPYNLGFIIGLLISVGGGIRVIRKKHHKSEHDWDRIEERVEEKVKKGITEWLQESDKEEKKKEWEEIGKRIEEKIKKALKEWFDEE